MPNIIEQIKNASKKALARKNVEISSLKDEVRKAKAADRSVIFKMPEEMVVANFPKVQEVKILNPAEPVDVQKVHIINHEKPAEVQKVHIVNHDERPKIQDVRVLNLEIEKTSAWLPGLMLKASEKLAGVWVDLWSRGLSVKITEQEKPLRVIVVDLDGNPTNPAPLKGSQRSSPGFPMIMHGNVTEIAQNAVSGRIVISNPGTAIQLPNVGSKVIIFTSLASNAGVICVGGKTVNATAGNETGSIIYPTGSATLKVNQANALWVDGSNVGDVVIYNIMS